jgi:hypothetical protein
MTPEQHINDLDAYVASLAYVLTQDSRKLALAWETLGDQVNQSPGYTVVLQCFFLKLPLLRSFMLRKSADPDAAIAVLHDDIKSKTPFDEYQIDDYSYSESEYRGGFRAQLADYSIASARRHGRTEIQPLDFLEGYLDAHDETYPPIDNLNWTDEALHVPFNTLSHIRGRFDACLWIRFDELRSELGLQTADAARKEPVDAAPPQLKHAVLSLLAEHPNYRSNCFLIMPFRETLIHQKIHAILKSLLSECGINLLRADDRVYSEDVLGNIEAYMYGCRFGIAVHDRVLSDNANPNVAFEVGYMLGLKKHVCLLKEQTVAALPSDLSGCLYAQFDSQNLEDSLRKSVNRWLRNKNFVITYDS